MSAAPKKKEEQLLEVLDVPQDREQGLSRNFEDPHLEELIPGMGGSVSPPKLSLVQETAEAVQALVVETQKTGGAEASPAEPVFEIGLDPAAPEGVAEELPVPEAMQPGVFQLDQSQASDEAVGSKTQSPQPLPQTVNPDPLEPSLVFSTPVQEEDASPGVLEIAQSPLVLRESVARFEMSEKLFELVVCELSFDQLVERALSAIMTALSAQAGSVLEMDQEKDEFFFRASVGGASPKNQLQAFRVPGQQGIVGHVAKTGEPTLIRDLESEQKHIRAIGAAVGFEAKSCMAAPIFVGGRTYGVIEVFNRGDGASFEEADLNTLIDGTRMLAKVLEVRFLTAELGRLLR